MSAGRRVVRQLLGLSGARALASLISAAWLVVAASQLSLVAFGDLILLLALGIVAATVSDSGIQLCFADHTARVGTIDRDALRLVLIRRISLGLATSTIAAGLYLLVAHDRRVIVPAVFAISILATIVYTSLLSAYRALGHVALDGANDVVSRSAMLVAGTVWLVHFHGGLLAAVALYSAVDLCSVLAVCWRLRHSIRPVAADRSATLDLRVRTMFPLAAALLVNIVYYRADVYLVGLLNGPADAGLYGAAYRLLDAAMIPGLVLANMVLAHTSGESTAVRSATIARFQRLAVSITAPVALVGILVGPAAVSLAFGSRFDDSRGIAVLLLLSAVPGAVVSVLVSVLGVWDRHALGRLAVVALTINVALNLVLIPRWGIAGAAVANLISQSLFALSLHRAARSATWEPSALVRGSTQVQPC